MTQVIIVRGTDGITRTLIDRKGKTKVYRPTKSSLQRLNVLTWRHQDKVEPFLTSDYVGFKLVIDDIGIGK